MAKTKTNDNSANLGFEAKLWLTADKLRNNMDAAELQAQFAKSEKLSHMIRDNLKVLGFPLSEKL